ncbi:hypothetical protein SBOR_8692 [Sclerotinia borealis F-4128]|uniref:Uncharacterized protein n=1 Tax=Sclerotinia borealis (strain F-4128) TaxID=1432307 RepID=W9C8P7_SCLBF|nr:hypothetical protein SBOR_8692 [Sclerotinia borealis F-4128]
MTSKLEKTTAKAEKAATELQNLKQNGKKLFDKQNLQLAQRKATLEKQGRKIAASTAEVNTTLQDLETTQQASATLKATYKPSSKLIESLQS